MAEADAIAEVMHNSTDCPTNDMSRDELFDLALEEMQQEEAEGILLTAVYEDEGAPKQVLIDYYLEKVA